MDYFLSFKGRFTRQDWWIVAVISYVLNLFIMFTWGMSMINSGLSVEDVTGWGYSFLWTAFTNASPIEQIFIFTLSAASYWIWATSNVKRYHDLGKSGFWTLIYFIPLIGPLWNLVECGIISGMPGTNQYDFTKYDHDEDNSSDMEDYSQAQSKVQTTSLGRHNFAAEEKGPKPLFGA